MAIQELPLVIQTSYAELLDQLRLATASDFPEGSTFRKRTISGKDYWYVQEPTTPQGRPPERYLGVDTPERRTAIDSAMSAKAHADTRKAIRRSLSGAGLPEPDGLTGAVIEAFAKAGVFRLRGVIVGTIAFQTYSGLLGVKLPNAAIRTGDVDLAQDYGVSVALNDALGVSLIDVLKSVDPDFAPIPSLAGPNIATTYARPGGYRVDVLTTNRGLPAKRHGRSRNAHALRGARKCSISGAVCCPQADCFNYAEGHWRECREVRQGYHSGWPSHRSARCQTQAGRSGGRPP